MRGAGDPGRSPRGAKIRQQIRRFFLPALIAVVVWVGWKFREEIIFWSFWDEPIRWSQAYFGLEDGPFRLVTLVVGVCTFALVVYLTWLARQQSAHTAAQIEIARKQSEAAVTGQYAERFVQAVGQVASGELAIRLGGLASLEALSRETPEESQRVWTWLGDFLRYPPQLDDWPPEPQAPQDEGANPPERPIGQRPDIAHIFAMLRNRKSEHKQSGQEQKIPFRLPLHKVWLQEADLQGADLRGAKLQEARLQRAKLQGADLQEAGLQGVRLQGADLQGARLHGADLDRTWLEGALLGSYGKEKPQDLSVCENLAPQQLRGTFYAKGGNPPTLPAAWEEEPWPEDCTPQPVRREAWLNFREVLLRL